MIRSPLGSRGSRVWGLGFRVRGFGVTGLGFGGVLGFRGLGPGVQGLKGFRLTV